MALETFFENSDKWFEHYAKLTEDEQYELLKDTFRSGIPDELANEIDFVDLLLDCFGLLKKERQFEKMSELYEVIYPQKQICGSDFFYVDKANIDFYLFCGEPGKIKQHLESFKEYPAHSFDALINVFNKLVFYNYTDIALDVAKSVHPKVACSDELMPGAEDDFENLIYMEKMQEIYQTLRAGEELNRNGIIQNLEEWGIKVEKELELIEVILSPEFNYYPDEVDFDEDRGRFIYKTMLLFAKYMFEEKNISFPAASSIWYDATDILLREYDDKEDNTDFDDIFTLDANVIRNKIIQRFGFLSQNSASAYSLAWGMRYFYDFLKKYDYISDSAHISAVDSIARIQAEIVAGRTDELWEYDFVHRWGKPDSIDEQEFIREKEMFEHTFRNETEIVKKPSIPVLKQNPAVKKGPKIGRNDLCPCGSGKKYKKCCEGNKQFS